MLNLLVDVDASIFSAKQQKNGYNIVFLQSIVKDKHMEMANDR